MKPYELLADLPQGPGDSHENILFLRLVLRYLADHVYQAELNSGARLSDPINVRQWLEELASATRPETSDVTEGQATPEFRTRLRVTGRVQEPEVCHRCGHTHQGRECGEDIGGGRKCRCELEGVPA